MFFSILFSCTIRYEMICMHKSKVITWRSNEISLRSLYGDNSTLYPFLFFPSDISNPDWLK